MSTAAIMDFVQRFHDLQQQRDTSNELIKDLLRYCEAVETGLRHENARLTKELEDAQLDLEDARRSRRDLQQQLTLAVQRVGQSTADADLMRNRNPYIQVLIDGDGMVFNEKLVRLGIEGGKQAAAALRKHVLEHCGDLTDEIEIIANVYSNQSGLSNAMLRDGSVEDIDQLKNFMVGFTQGKASFDSVDVGHGKERADSKIKELMRWHLRNHNCKQILLGISHDAGYAPFLDEVVSHDDRCRVTIMEGPPTVRELTSSGIQILNFNKIFRSAKLAERVNGSSLPPSTWAGVTSIAPPAPSPVMSKNGLAPKKSNPVASLFKPTWVPGPRGPDPHIPVNSIALEKIKRRTNNNKLCNNHYLRGPCAKGDDCCFEHNYKANDEDLKAIAFLTRLNPCLSGQDCEFEFCIYGHHCPSVQYTGKDKEPVCTAFGCRFSEDDHPPGTIIKHPRKENMQEYRY